MMSRPRSFGFTTSPWCGIERGRGVSVRLDMRSKKRQAVSSPTRFQPAQTQSLDGQDQESFLAGPVCSINIVRHGGARCGLAVDDLTVEGERPRQGRRTTDDGRQTIGVWASAVDDDDWLSTGMLRAVVADRRRSEIEPVKT